MTAAGRLWRSPALRFLALGAALFGLESFAHARRPTALTLRPAVVQSLRRELRGELHRDPTRAELTARAERYADDERLYREAVARRVWEGDPVLRQRLVERAAWTLRGELPTAAPTPDDLARTLARHPDRYAVPPRVSFTQVFVARALHPADAPAALASLDAALARHDDPSALGDAPPFDRVALARNDATIASEYGGPFADAVRALPVGAWSSALETRYGWHRVMVTARLPPARLTVAQAGARLVADWRDDQRDDLDRRARDRLRARMPLRFDPASAP